MLVRRFWGAGAFSFDAKIRFCVSRYDLQITASSFIGLCSYWLPKAPEGCGIHPTRCSQDPVEAYFNYVRSCGGANSHPTIGECFAAGAGYSTTAVLSKHANNGVAMDGARGAGARNKRVFDNDDTLAFPLHGRRGGSWRRDDDRDSGGVCAVYLAVIRWKRRTETYPLAQGKQERSRTEGRKRTEAKGAECTGDQSAHLFSFLLLFATPPLVVVWTFADL